MNLIQEPGAHDRHFAGGGRCDGRPQGVTRQIPRAQPCLGNCGHDLRCLTHGLNLVSDEPSADPLIRARRDVRDK